MRNKVGIIVPYRDRYKHLTQFIPHITQYLQDKKIDFTIIIVEQDNASAFNRGMLCNIGFKEAKKQDCTYVIFHDVDMLPIDIDYSYSNHPVHLATQDITFPSYFGGITLFPVEDFEKINGFSNIYWGWGFEDDDLRYRCVKNNIGFKLKTVENNFKSCILNGTSGYIRVPNVINYNSDFTININLHLDRLLYSTDKEVDIFPIFSIPGYDFQLSYSSFNRFYLQVFDNKNKYFDIFSDYSTQSSNNITIEYIKIVNRIKFTVNNIKVGYIDLSSQIFNYKNQDAILLGTNTNKTEFFKGTIDYFSILQQGVKLIEYKSPELENYELKDLSGNKNNGTLNDIYVDKFKSPKDFYSYEPHRRNSSIKFLPHKTDGYVDGKWRNNTTRWNQLRYNNEVQTGVRDNIEDGLSNCEYTLHGKTIEGTYTHLNVGI